MAAGHFFPPPQVAAVVAMTLVADKATATRAAVERRTIIMSYRISKSSKEQQREKDCKLKRLREYEWKSPF